MKFYKICIGYRQTRDRYISYPEGKIIKNFKDYFEQDPDIISIIGFNKKGYYIYQEMSDGRIEYAIRNERNVRVYIKYVDGKIAYPQGKEVYDKYMNKYKKQKLEKILNNEREQ